MTAGGLCEDRCRGMLGEGARLASIHPRDHKWARPKMPPRVVIFARARGVSPYGDGRAAERIVAHLAEHLVERENRISSFVSKRTEP